MNMVSLCVLVLFGNQPPARADATNNPLMKAVEYRRKIRSGDIHWTIEDGRVFGNHIRHARSRYAANGDAVFSFIPDEDGIVVHPRLGKAYACASINYLHKGQYTWMQIQHMGSAELANRADRRIMDFMTLGLTMDSMPSTSLDKFAEYVKTRADGFRWKEVNGLTEVQLVFDHGRKTGQPNSIVGVKTWTLDPARGYQPISITYGLNGKK